MKKNDKKNSGKPLPCRVVRSWGLSPYYRNLLTFFAFVITYNNKLLHLLLFYTFFCVQFHFITVYAFWSFNLFYWLKKYLTLSEKFFLLYFLTFLLLNYSKYFLLLLLFNYSKLSFSVLLLCYCCLAFVKLFTTVVNLAFVQSVLLLCGLSLLWLFLGVLTVLNNCIVMVVWLSILGLFRRFSVVLPIVGTNSRYFRDIVSYWFIGVYIIK